MPPKRKSANSDTDEWSKRSRVVKKAEPPRTRKEMEHPSKLESSEYKDPIKFDEYMEGGIPDALLEGLGFSETGAAPEAVCADDDEEDDVGTSLEAAVVDPSSAGVVDTDGLSEAISSYVVSQLTKGGMIGNVLPQQLIDFTIAASNRSSPLLSTSQASTAMAAHGKKLMTSSVALPVRSSRRLSSRTSAPSSETISIDSNSNSPVKMSPAARQTPTSAAAARPVSLVRNPTAMLFAGARNPALASSSAQMKPKNHLIYTSAPKTVTKGNIVYERMPTGEVIASLVRKPASDSPTTTTRPNQRHPTVIESTTGRQSSSYVPNVARATATTVRATVAAAAAAPSPINLDDCPINEHNVSDVLERSMRATQSMRMLLTSLRDDLRRIGAGSAMITEEQIRKRTEVAEKLTKAYATYKRSIEDIETPVPTVDSGARYAAASGATRRAPAADAVRPVMLINIKHGAGGSGGRVVKICDARSGRVQATRPRRSPADKGEVIELSDDEVVDSKESIVKIAAMTSTEERGADKKSTSVINTENNSSNNETERKSREKKDDDDGDAKETRIENDSEKEENVVDSKPDFSNGRGNDDDVDGGH